MVDQRAGWGFPIQWPRGYGEEIRFRTEIITSRNGTEQRIAQRINPRLTYEFESFLNFKDFRQAVQFLSENQARRIAVPHPRRSTVMTAEVDPDTTTTRAVCISIDNSGSMATGGRLESMKEAMGGVIDGLLAARAQGTLTRLDLRITAWGDTAVSFTAFDAQDADLEAARTFVTGLAADQGGTDFDQAATEAVAFFNATLGTILGRRVWLFITDGEPTGSSHIIAENTADDLLDRSSGLFQTALGTKVDCYGVNIQEPNVTATRRLDNTPEDDVPVVSALDPDALLHTMLSGFFGQVISVEETGPWMVNGTPVFLEDDQNRELVNVIRRSATAIYTDAAVRNSFGPGTKVRGGVYGYFSQESELRAATTRVGLSRVNFDADPQFTYHEDFSVAPPDTINGLEFLKVGHQWAGDLQVSFEQPFEGLDLQRGVSDRLFPVDYTARLTRLRIVIRNDDQYNRVVGLFYRCKGRQKPFYATTFVDEIRPVGNIISLTNTLTFRGREFYDQFNRQGMYRRLQIVTRLATYVRTITSMSVNAAGDTIVTFDQNFPSAVDQADIYSISWIVKHRFETDRLSLEWLTDGVAEVTMTIRTLEDNA